MKKTMFITSVIMVVVMAIALTTSSLAWFNAAGQATVTTAPLRVKAAADAGTGFQISLDAAEAFGNSVTLDNSPSPTAMKPLVPVIDAASGTAYALSTYTFIGNNTTMDGTTKYFAHSDGTYNGTGDATYTDGYYTDDVYIRNTGNATANIAPTIKFYGGDATITANTSETTFAAGDPVLNVAVLWNDTTNTAWKVVKIFSTASASADWTVVDVEHAATGRIASGALVASSTGKFAPEAITVTNTVSMTGVSTSGSDVTYTVEQFRIVAWYDGAQLNNGNASNADVQFVLSFATPAAPQQQGGGN